MTANGPAPTEVQPPSTEVGALGWLRHNLFNSVPSAIATIVVLVILVLATIAIAEWVLEARWGVITTNMRLFLVGRYPQDQIWRVAVTMSVLSLLYHSLRAK